MTPDVPRTETPQQVLERLRAEVEQLRASRERLARSADADRRRIERELHDGPQQQLVALAVNLELARRLAESDPAGLEELLDEMGRDVRQALDETGKLAHRIYPPLLDAGGLPAALRAAAAAAGVRIRVDIAATEAWAPEIAATVYFCCLDLLERAADSGDAHLTVTMREEGETLVFEIVDREADSAVELVSARDSVEALGGRLEAEPEPGRGIRISGSLPLSR